MNKLLEVMAKLRDPEQGCPWDLQQTFASIRPYTIEEAYEVAEAIDQDDMPALKQELGDLLFQVVYHAQMAAEAGYFDFAEVVEAITEKMIRRHPHVFADTTAPDLATQGELWEAMKAAEREVQDESAMADVPLALPALMRAHKLQKRAARVGFDWSELAPVLTKVREELDELEQALKAEDAEASFEETGDCLFALVNLARHQGLAAESVLVAANAKFERRFRQMEALLAQDGMLMAEADSRRQEQAWQAVKAAEASEA